MSSAMEKIVYNPAPLGLSRFRRELEGAVHDVLVLAYPRAMTVLEILNDLRPIHREYGVVCDILMFLKKRGFVVDVGKIAVSIPERKVKQYKAKLYRCAEDKVELGLMVRSVAKVARKTTKKSEHFQANREKQNLMMLSAMDSSEWRSRQEIREICEAAGVKFGSTVMADILLELLKAGRLERQRSIAVGTKIVYRRVE